MSGEALVWTWRFRDPAGEPLDELAPDLHTRFDAEAWLGEHWRAIARRGAAHAVLLCGGEPVGPGADLREFRI